MREEGDGNQDMLLFRVKCCLKANACSLMGLQYLQRLIIPFCDGWGFTFCIFYMKIEQNHSLQISSTSQRGHEPHMTISVLTLSNVLLMLSMKMRIAGFWCNPFPRPFFRPTGRWNGTPSLMPIEGPSVTRTSNQPSIRMGRHRSRSLFFYRIERHCLHPLLWRPNLLIYHSLPSLDVPPPGTI